MSTTATPDRPPSLDHSEGQWALETDDLTVKYGDFTAADRISIRVARGEIYGLLGPNGAGKTSVIRALTTIVPAASGSASIDGAPLSDPGAVRSAIGVLPESNGYPGAQTGGSYLRFYGQLFGLTRYEADDRSEQLLHQFGLGDAFGQISTYSRGMRQRLGLARALINRPAVLFLDEPTLGLDPAGREDIMKHITRSAVDEGTCIVLCSHLLDEVERVCDRVAIMDRSRIIAEGPVSEVIAVSEVAGHGRIRVPPSEIPTAEAALRASPAAAAIAFDNKRPGYIDILLDPSDDTGSQVLRTVLDAGVQILAFDIQGVRLSDAFLALTGATRSTAGEDGAP